MPGIARLGDKCTGHGSCAPRTCVEGSSNVFINGKPAHRAGDKWAVHCKHDSVLAAGSTKIFINGKGAGRIGDSVACGSVVATSSGNVFAS